eukprot:gene3692-biopygen12129
MGVAGIECHLGPLFSRSGGRRRGERPSRRPRVKRQLPRRMSRAAAGGISRGLDLAQQRPRPDVGPLEPLLCGGEVVDRRLPSRRLTALRRVAAQGGIPRSTPPCHCRFSRDPRPQPLQRRTPVAATPNPLRPGGKNRLSSRARKMVEQEATKGETRVASVPPPLGVRVEEALLPRLQPLQQGPPAALAPVCLQGVLLRPLLLQPLGQWRVPELAQNRAVVPYRGLGLRIRVVPQLRAALRARRHREARPLGEERPQHRDAAVILPPAQRAAGRLHLHECPPQAEAAPRGVLALLRHVDEPPGLLLRVVAYELGVRAERVLVVEVGEVPRQRLEQRRVLRPLRVLAAPAAFLAQSLDVRFLPFALPRLLRARFHAEDRHVLFDRRVRARSRVRGWRGKVLPARSRARNTRRAFVSANRGAGAQRPSGRGSGDPPPA